MGSRVGAGGDPGGSSDAIGCDIWCGRDSTETPPSKVKPRRGKSCVQSNAESSQSKPGQAKPGQAKQTKPSQA